MLGPSGRVAELVARGEAEMAIQQIPELLPVTGAQYAGPFPPELQLYSEFAAGVATASQHREVADGLRQNLDHAGSGGAVHSRGA